MNKLETGIERLIVFGGGNVQQVSKLFNIIKIVERIKESSRVLSIVNLADVATSQSLCHCTLVLAFSDKHSSQLLTQVRRY